MIANFDEFEAAHFEMIERIDTWLLSAPRPAQDRLVASLREFEAHHGGTVAAEIVNEEPPWDRSRVDAIVTNFVDDADVDVLDLQRRSSEALTIVNAAMLRSERTNTPVSGLGESIPGGAPIRDLAPLQERVANLQTRLLETSDQLETLRDDLERLAAWVDRARHIVETVGTEALLGRKTLAERRAVGTVVEMLPSLTVIVRGAELATASRASVEHEKLKSVQKLNLLIGQALLDRHLGGADGDRVLIETLAAWDLPKQAR